MESTGKAGRWEELGHWGTGPYFSVIDIQIGWNPESEKLVSPG